MLNAFQKTVKVYSLVFLILYFSFNIGKGACLELNGSVKLLNPVCILFIQLLGIVTSLVCLLGCILHKCEVSFEIFHVTEGFNKHLQRIRVLEYVKVALSLEHRISPNFRRQVVVETYAVFHYTLHTDIFNERERIVGGTNFTIKRFGEVEHLFKNLRFSLMLVGHGYPHIIRLISKKLLYTLFGNELGVHFVGAISTEQPFKGLVERSLTITIRSDDKIESVGQFEGILFIIASKVLYFNL